MTDGRQTTTVP